ncbi:MAG: hypothetical protein LUE11_11470 [Clostridia bacterium]|nr:hypothetical protein [Clostridia bacterium]
MKTALKAAGDLRTGVGIRADIRTALSDGMYTICTVAALDAQRKAGTGKRRRYT